MTPFAVTSGNISSEVLAWIARLEAGQAEIVVTSEGSRFSFNNDGGNHYLEYIDVTRREPNGRYKRVYKGKIEGGHVTYKGVTSVLECSTEYAKWSKTPYGRKGREDQGFTRPPERRDARLEFGDRGTDARPDYIH